MKSVVIVGGGVIGLFCAVRLAKSGARVTVLEAEGEHATVYGAGASAAAAGMLAPFGEAPSLHDRLSLASYDLWREWRDGAEWADGVRFDGGVAIGDGEATLARAAALGRRVEPLSASQFHKRTGLRTKLENAVFAEEEGVADPLRVLSGLAMQARALGVLIEYGRDVAELRSNAAVTNADEVYEADVIVLASGFWGVEKLAAFAPALSHVTPGKGHLVPVMLEHSLGPNVRGRGFYIAQRREDVVLGATMEPGRYDRRVEPARVEQLLAAVNAVLPGEVTPAGRAWAGIRPMSPDGWPIIGQSGDALVATGHSRNGWLLAPITAEIVSAYVFGAEIPPEWAALSPARLRPHDFRPRPH